MVDCLDCKDTVFFCFLKNIDVIFDFPENVQVTNIPLISLADFFVGGSLKSRSSFAVVSLPGTTLSWAQIGSILGLDIPFVKYRNGYAIPCPMCTASPVAQNIADTFIGRTTFYSIDM